MQYGKEIKLLKMSQFSIIKLWLFFIKALRKFSELPKKFHAITLSINFCMRDFISSFAISFGYNTVFILDMRNMEITLWKKK